MGAIDILKPSTTALRKGPTDLKEDLKLFKAGILDFKGLRNGYRQVVNPVEARTTSLINDDQVVDPDFLVIGPHGFTDGVLGEDGIWRDRAFDMKRRIYREIRRSKNLRTNGGRDTWQRVLMSGDIAANLGYTGTATASGATSLTATGTPWTASQWIGHIVVATGNTYGVIRSNTTSVLTIDQWYTLGSSTAAVATTPSATAVFCILPGQSPAMWIGLDSTATAPAATATALGSEETTNGLARAFQPATYPAGQFQFAHTWTYSTTTSKTVYNVGLFDSGPGTGGTLILFTALSASATVNASGDTIAVTWTVTL